MLATGGPGAMTVEAVTAGTSADDPGYGEGDRAVKRQASLVSRKRPGVQRIVIGYAQEGRGAVGFSSTTATS